MIGRTVFIRAGFVVLMGWAAWKGLGLSDEGTLRVEIRDRATGQIVPAMVAITSLADGRWRIPPDGRVSPPYSTNREFYEPPPWKPGDIGPVRLTSGDYKNNNTRSYVYGEAGCYPFWKEPAAYFVSRPFSMALPAGKWRLAVERGIEYLPVFEEFEIAPGQTRERKIALARWVDMPGQGWYSGDDHVHFPRLKPEHDEFLMTWARAEDVHVANILRMGDLKNVFFEQAGYGKPARFQQGDYVLASGQEDPRTDISEQGHTIALNITAPVRDTARYHLYDFMFDGVRAQGGITGYAHNAWATGEYRRTRPELFPTWDPAINIPRGKVDFFEVLQFRRLGLEDYYDFLNLGFKLTASAGSDLPWGNTMGEARLYAYTGRRFSADAWFAAVKQGRTFVTNGPMLTLQVERAMPGDEVRVAKGAKVRVRARAWAPPAIGSPKLLEIVAHGRVIRSAEAAGATQSELGLEFTLQADGGQWIAARATTRNGGLAHTSPVYVFAGGGSFADRKELPRLVQKRFQVLDFIAERLRNTKFTREYAPGEADALRERLAEARARYGELLTAQ